jgi:hypothetical protein
MSGNSHVTGLKPLATDKHRWNTDEIPRSADLTGLLIGYCSPLPGQLTGVAWILEWLARKFLGENIFLINGLGVGLTGAPEIQDHL